MNFLLYIYTYICARIYIRVYTYFPFRPVPSVPSFMNARSTNDAQRQRAARSTCCTCYLPRQVQSYVLWFFFFFLSFITHVYRGFYFVFRVVPALCERWLHGCLDSFALFSPFLFVSFFLLTIFTLIQLDSTRRDGTIISLDLSSTIFAIVILLYRNIQTHLILLPLALTHNCSSPVPSFILLLLFALPLSLSLTRAILSCFLIPRLQTRFSRYFSLSPSVTRVITFIRRASRKPRTIDFSSSFPLPRNFRLIEKEKRGKT